MRRMLAIGLVLTAIVPRVHADDLERKTRAVALIKQALPLQEAGRHVEALKLLDESWARFAHPKALFYKGRSLVALERWEDGRVLYEQLRASTRDLEADKLAEVEANLAQCKAEIASLYQQNRDLAANQRVAAGPADLGVGVALSAVGVGLVTTGIWLLVAD